MARALGLGLLIQLIAGCATIMSGTTENLTVTTTPEDAEIVVKHGNEVVYDGKAPWTGPIRKRLPIRVTAKKEGYKNRVQEVPRKVSFWYRMNYLLLATTLWIDKRNGSAWILVQPSVHLELDKRPPPADLANLLFDFNFVDHHRTLAFLRTAASIPPR